MFISIQTVRRLTVGLLSAVAVVALLNACIAPVSPAATQATSAAVITITAADFSFEAPKTIPSGWTTINLENLGMEPHHAQLVRLNDGVTPEQFQAALQESETAIFALITTAGGPSVIDPTGKTQVMVDLTPGTYFLLCFMPSADGVSHLTKGMIAQMQVTESANGAAKPQADQVVKLLDYSFVLPSEIKAGKQVWEVVNEGHEAHEMPVMKLAEGKTVADIGAFFEHPDGPPPFSDVGGMQAIDPGQTAYAVLDLTPGEYVVMCAVPSPANQGKPHFELGMVMTFTVK